MPNLKTVGITAGIALLVYLLVQLLANFGFDLAGYLPRPGASTSDSSATTAQVA